MKKTLILLTTLLYVIAAPLVQAQMVGEHIESYGANIEIRQDGTIDVKESILYDFASLQRHGIIREIPTTKTNKEGKKFRLDYSDISVTDEAGTEYAFKKSTENNIMSLKIGDADRTITGKHTYNIHYIVKGALTYFSDHDELNWNVVGTEWQIPIAQVQTEIILPDTVPAEGAKATCYVGVAGSTSSACSLDVTGKTIKIGSTGTLQPGEGLTAVVGFKQGSVTRVEPVEVIAFTDTWYGKLVAKAAVAGLILAALFWYVGYPLWLPYKWYKQGRDPKTGGAIRAGFDPPETKTGRSLSPSETGTLVDEQAEIKDVLAMVIDLARRGYFSIVEKEKDVFYLMKQEKAKKDDVLLPFENTFIQKAFASGSEFKIKDAKLATTVEAIKKSLYSSMVTEGFFPENPDKIHTFYNGIVAAAVMTFNVPLILSALIFGRNMAKRTLFGAQQKDIATSLKNFLSSQERQLKFQAEKQLFFEKLLPYAVAFGVEKIWTDRFADMNLQQPDWYQGYNTTSFNNRVFLHSMNSSFSQFTSAATPTTSSSGFSSGFSGGSSGGGGGGGGGGSW